MGTLCADLCARQAHKDERYPIALRVDTLLDGKWLEPQLGTKQQAG